MWEWKCCQIFPSNPNQACCAVVNESCFSVFCTPQERYVQRWVQRCDATACGSSTCHWASCLFKQINCWVAKMPCFFRLQSPYPPKWNRINCWASSLPNIFQVFSPHTYALRKRMFPGNVALFERGINRLCNSVRFIPKRHWYNKEIMLVLKFLPCCAVNGQIPPVCICFRYPQNNVQLLHWTFESLWRLVC